MFGKNKSNQKKKQKGNIDVPNNMSGAGNNNYDSDALDWESQISLMSSKSERRAWFVAKCSVAGFVLSALAIFALAPLKESVPYVVRVDKTTGGVDVITSARGQNITIDEAVDKSYLNTYILNREAYEWTLIRNQYLTTQALSTNDVFKPYSDFYQSNGSYDKRYGDNKRVEVKIISITVTDQKIPVEGQTTANNIAVVRFVKNLRDSKTNGLISSSNWVANISYTYDSNIIMPADERLLNPLGFKVTSYKVDPEVNNLTTPTPQQEEAGVISAPPAPVEAKPTPVAQPQAQ